MPSDLPPFYAPHLAHPADGVPLKDEPRDVKATRMLDLIEAFVNDPSGVCGIVYRDQFIVLVKVADQQDVDLLAGMLSA